MERITILGSSGAGKTTLAKELGSRLGIKVHHLDRLLWEADWQRIDNASRKTIMQKLIREKQWIIEGTYLDSSECRLNAADTIIFLDTPPFKCLWRVIKRHYRERGCSRLDIPEGSTNKLTFEQIMKVLTFPLIERVTIKETLGTNSYKRIIWLKSSNDVAVFLTDIELFVAYKKGSDLLTLLLPVDHMVLTNARYTVRNINRRDQIVG